MNKDVLPFFGIFFWLEESRGRLFAGGKGGTVAVRARAWQNGLKATSARF